MKKYLAFVLVLMMLFAFAACGSEKPVDTSTPTESGTSFGEKETETEKGQEPPVDETKVMTHAEYAAAADETPVVIEAYVQDKQVYSAQYGNTCLYLQDEDGAYFVYRWKCTQEEYDAVKLGAKVRVTGFKGSWSGEQEVTDAKVEVIDGAEFLATPIDVTDLLGTDELINYQNMYVVFTGMTVEAYNDAGDAFAYKSEDGSDIYYKVSVKGVTYDFCVESDLRTTGSDAYEAVKAFKVGDKVDIVGFLYWYNGPNPHTTGVTKVTSYAEYAAAADDTAVVIEAYVQDKQVYSAQYGNTCLYLQDEVGGYFVYRWKCSQEEYDAVKLGAKVRVTGYKASWSGEQEIADATVEILSDSGYIAAPLDVTALLGTDELIKYQNMYVIFKGVTVAAYDDKGAAFAYKSEDGSDIYYKVTVNGATYDFCVESDLRTTGSDAYEAVKAFKVGDVVDVVGFLYWYNGPNPHTTGIVK